MVKRVRLLFSPMAFHQCRSGEGGDNKPCLSRIGIVCYVSAPSIIDSIKPCFFAMKLRVLELSRNILLVKDPSLTRGVYLPALIWNSVMPIWEAAFRLSESA